MASQFEERFLRLSAVLSRTGLTRPTLYRMVLDGRFPKQVQIAPRCVAWKESDVQGWMNDRIAET